MWVLDLTAREGEIVSIVRLTCFLGGDCRQR